MFGPDKCGNDNKVRALDYLSQIHIRPPLNKKLFPVHRPSVVFLLFFSSYFQKMAFFLATRQTGNTLFLFLPKDGLRVKLDYSR